MELESMCKIEKVKEHKDKLRSWYRIFELIEENEDFLIFGSGIAARSTYEFLRLRNKNILGFLDNDSDKIGKEYCGRKIFPPEKIREFLREGKVKIIISSGWFMEIAHQLIYSFNLNPLNDFFPFFAYDWFISNVHGGKEFFSSFLKEEYSFNFILNSFQDMASKRNYEKIFVYRSLLLNPELFYLRCLPRKYSFQSIKALVKDKQSPKYLNKLYKKLRVYLHPGINYKEKKCIIDGGAFVGDTALLFAELSHNAFIYSFEPNPDSYEALKKNTKHINRICCINKGLGIENGEATLKKCLSNPRTTNIKVGKNIDKGSIVKISSIDSFVDKENITPDLIKLDIEGMELEALKGAEQTIREFQPDLIVALYHKGTDLINIPLWLMKNFEFYKFFIHHTDIFISSTLLIAISEKRRTRN